MTHSPAKKVVLLTGVYQNAGDALIAKRARSLITQVRKDLQLIELNRRTEPSELLTKQSGLHCIITGGPHWQLNMVPRLLPHIEKFMDADIVISSWGGGWRGPHTHPPNEATSALIKYIKNCGGFVGVRDNFSVNRLKKFGLSVEMTGCPAWFGGVPRTFKPLGQTLVISAGAKAFKEERSFESLHELVIHARQAGWNTIVFFQHPIEWYLQTSRLNADKLLSQLRNLGVLLYDSQGQLRRMKQAIDSATVHIGWRLHSHIYACTRSIPSLAIAEDERASNMGPSMGFQCVSQINDPRIRLVLEHRDFSGIESSIDLQPAIQKCREKTNRFLKEL
jgi:polysaccharide pyruvyl transferase WcaK-like protein